MPMNPRLMRPRSASIAGDSDVQNYIAAVEAADGQTLEQGVKDALRDFILGCKTDGIWTAIKAGCILMGARTLSGALTPLVGSAPTNVNFVSGDYTRGGATPGLLGNGSTKYLNANRNNNADPQNSKHIAVRMTAITATVDANLIGALPSTGVGRSDILRTGAGNTTFAVTSTSGTVQRTGFTVGLIGASRNNSSTIDTRTGGTTTSPSLSSTTPYNGNVFVFARNLDGSPNAYLTGRIAFYSIGESLDLSLLDSRVSTLVTAIGAAIP